MNNKSGICDFEPLEPRLLMSATPVPGVDVLTQEAQAEYRIIVDAQDLLSQPLPNVDSILANAAALDMQFFRDGGEYTKEQLPTLSDMEHVWENTVDGEGLQFNQAQDQLTTIDQSLEVMLTDLAVREERSTGLQNSLQNTEQNLTEARAERTMLREQLREQNSVIAQINSTIRELRIQIRNTIRSNRPQLRSQLYDTRDDLGQAYSERSKTIMQFREVYIPKIRELAQQRSSLINQLSEENRNIEDANDAITSLEQQRSEISGMVHKSMHDFAFATAMHTEVQEEIQECEGAIAEREMAQQMVQALVAQQANILEAALSSDNVNALLQEVQSGSYEEAQQALSQGLTLLRNFPVSTEGAVFQSIINEDFSADTLPPNFTVMCGTYALGGGLSNPIKNSNLMIRTNDINFTNPVNIKFAVTQALAGSRSGRFMQSVRIGADPETGTGGIVLGLGQGCLGQTPSASISAEGMSTEQIRIPLLFQFRNTIDIDISFDPGTRIMSGSISEGEYGAAFSVHIPESVSLPEGCLVFNVTASDANNPGDIYPGINYIIVEESVNPIYQEQIQDLVQQEASLHMAREDATNTLSSVQQQLIDLREMISEGRPDTVPFLRKYIQQLANAAEDIETSSRKLQEYLEDPCTPQESLPLWQDLKQQYVMSAICVKSEILECQQYELELWNGMDADQEEQTKLLLYHPRMLVTAGGTGFGVRYRSPNDTTYFEVQISCNGKDGNWWTKKTELITHEGGEMDGSWGYGFGQDLIGYGPTLDFEILMWNGIDKTQMLDRAIGRVSRIDNQLRLETEQFDWDYRDTGRMEKNPISPSLSVIQLDGPNALVNFSAPIDQSLIEITGGGILSTYIQSHEGGTYSSCAQVTMNAQKPKGNYQIRLLDRSNGLILDSVSVYWSGSGLSLLNEEDRSEADPTGWNIPADYSFSSSLVRENFQSEMLNRSDLGISVVEAETSFYERHPEYHPSNIQATIDKKYAESPGFTRGQVENNIIGDQLDTLERIHRGLNAYNSVLQGTVFPAACNIFQGVLNGIPESQLYEQLDYAMSSLGRGRVIDLYTYTNISAPSRSQVISAAQYVYFNSNDLITYYDAADERLLAKQIVSQEENPAITAARERGELWASFMDQIRAGTMTVDQAFVALSYSVNSSVIASNAYTVHGATIVAEADPSLIEVGGMIVEEKNAIVSVSEANIPLGGSLEIQWSFNEIYGDAVESINIYLVDLTQSGLAKSIQIPPDQLLQDGSYILDTSKLITQEGEYRILGVATLANGRIVGGQVDVRVGDYSSQNFVPVDVWSQMSDAQKAQVESALDFGDLSDLPQNQKIIDYLIENYLQNGEMQFDPVRMRWVGEEIQNNPDTTQDDIYFGECKYWAQMNIILKATGSVIPSNKNVPIGDNPNNTVSYSWKDSDAVIRLTEEGNLASDFEDVIQSSDIRSGDCIQISGGAFYSRHTMIIGEIDEEGIWVFDSNAAETKTPAYRRILYTTFHSADKFTIYRIK